MAFPHPAAASKKRFALSESHRTANIVPNAVRSMLGLVEDRALPPERLCRGLGFTYQDLHDRDLLLSYHQVRSLILRARALLGDASMGLAAGMRQTPVSWGLAGLAMLTCETFGEAIGYGLAHQNEAGAMMHHRFEQQGREVAIELMPHVFDLEIEPYLIEEAFASALNVSRCMVGPEIRPRCVEFAFAKPAQAPAYARFFRCPVRFDTGRNRMSLDAKWLATRLPGYDRITCGLLRQQLNTLIQRSAARNDLIESIAMRLRAGAEAPPRQPELARQANLSERTLRRRLGAQSVGYRALRDAALYERAQDLLKNSGMRVADVAQAVGYADARTFRRAFQRWSGTSPKAFRNGG
ncbi:AraC family transcriptional regulator ligand-binding domain-containing protein [Xanthomonas bundabergensis]|uniref:AraC family transcriptional regulator ligand-binding domain-containing protein n=1 Tax=Xanthomonas bundabergensis TaxID=3160842 RepID=UPI0035111C02